MDGYGQHHGSGFGGDDQAIETPEMHKVKTLTPAQRKDRVQTLEKECEKLERDIERASAKVLRYAAERAMSRRGADNDGVERATGEGGTAVVENLLKRLSRVTMHGASALDGAFVHEYTRSAPTSAEIADVRTSFGRIEPAEVSDFVSHTLANLASVDTDAAKVAEMDEATWQACAHLPKWSTANVALARALRAHLDKTAPRPKFVLSELTAPGALQDGRAVLAAIRASATLSFAAAEEHEAKFGAKAFFDISMTEAAVQEAVLDMKNELAVGPPELRAHAFYIQRHMVAKFACVPGCAKKAEELREKIFDGAIIGKEPFTPKQLASIIAGALRRARAEGGGTAAAAGGDVLKCVVCGKTGHTGKECTRKCSECKLKFCPGARGEECVVCAQVKPGPELRNALGKRLPFELLVKLQEEWERKHPRGAGPGAAAAAGDSDEVDMTAAW